MNFTWGYSGTILNLLWGLKAVGADNIANNGRLVTLNADGTSDSTSAPSTYTGRVAGRLVGGLPTGKAIFTLSSVKKEDKGLYACLITPQNLASDPVFDYVQLLLQGG